MPNNKTVVKEDKKLTQKKRINFYSILLKILFFARDKPILFVIAMFPSLFAIMILISIPFILLVIFFHIESRVIWAILGFIPFIVIVPIFYCTVILMIETNINLGYRLFLILRLTWIARIFEWLVSGVIKRQFLHKLIKWTADKENKLIKKRN